MSVIIWIVSTGQPMFTQLQDAAHISLHFYQPGVCKACARLVLRLLSCFPFVCMYVYVCVRLQISRALNYVILLLCHYSHECSGSY